VALRRTVIAVLIVGAVAAACGSGGGRPLDMAKLVAGPSTGGTGHDVPGGPVGGGEPVGDPSVTGDGSTNGAGSGGPAAKVATGHTTGSAAATQAAAGAAGGVSGGKIILGWEGLADTTAAAVNSVGVKASETTEKDLQAIIRAIASDVNARGGIGGKQVEVIFHFVDVTQGTADSRGQATCEFFTTDHPVFALLMSANHNQSLTRCMASRHVPVVDVSASVLPNDQTDLDQQAPYLYLPVRLNLSRLGAYIDALANQGFFDGGAKVGLLRYDWTTHQRARDQVIIPALARHGIQLTDDYAFSVVQTVGDVSTAAGQAASAVLRFKAKGVNRVLFLPTGWVLLTVFPPAAESQAYRPRYGLNSWESPSYLTDNAPKAQLHGAVGIGWEPLEDLDRAGGRSLDYLRATPHWGHCAAAVRRAGFDETRAWMCTPFLFLQEAIARGGSVSAAGIRAGADKLGSTPFSTATLGSSYGPGRYDGAGVGRNVAFDDGCGCFNYVGAPYPIP